MSLGYGEVASSRPTPRWNPCKTSGLAPLMSVPDLKAWKADSNNDKETRTAVPHERLPEKEAEGMQRPERQHAPNSKKGNY